jgi:FkbM family methyltransferase
MADMKRLIGRALRHFNVVLTRGHTFDRLIQSERELHRLRECWELLRHMDASYMKRALELLPHASGENFQDLFVALLLGDREGGFFVEFGATDGVAGSNTLMFERQLGWDGIVAEPARVWHRKLARNRTCAIAHECVWSTSGDEVEFCEVGDTGFSTIARFAEADGHASKRQRSAFYSVPTISLDDLLARHNAPDIIDFLSLDTEGSELEILNAFSFDRYRVSALIVEHRFGANRDAIKELLTSKGMTRVLPDLSKYDDWYVANGLVSIVEGMFPGETMGKS